MIFPLVAISDELVITIFLFYYPPFPQSKHNLSELVKRYISDQPNDHIVIRSMNAYYIQNDFKFAWIQAINVKRSVVNPQFHTHLYGVLFVYIAANFNQALEQELFSVILKKRSYSGTQRTAEYKRGRTEDASQSETHDWSLGVHGCEPSIDEHHLPSL